METLWKKEHKNVGAFYADILKDIQSQFPNKCKNIDDRINGQLNSENEKKNDKVAIDHRQKGNAEFAESKWLEAMHNYNKSICFCENGSENMSIAFANRSACFIELKQYKKCIVDIELAIGAKYPKRLMSKILKRREDCLRLLEEDNEPDDVATTLSFDTDHRFPGMANVLELKYEKEFGRHITAKCNIDAGKFVLIEEAYAKTYHAKEWKSCFHCSKIETNLIPCNGCTYVMYCSGVCIEDSILHKTECQLYNIGVTPKTMDKMLIIRSIFAAINIFPCVDELITFVEAAVNQNRDDVPVSTLDLKSKYRSFLQLNVHLNEACLLEFSILIYEVHGYISLLASLMQIFDTPKKQRFLMHLIGQHVCVISNNGFNSETTKSVYLIQSYFNHSCSPNLIHFANGNEIFCLTSRPIEKGEQLFISYLDLDKETDLRQIYLYQKFGFRCKCESCEPCLQSIAADKRKFPNFGKELMELVASIQNLLGTNERADKRKAKKKVFRAKELCIEFLSKYGRLHWNDHIKVVVQTLTQLLVDESAWITED